MIGKPTYLVRFRKAWIGKRHTDVFAWLRALEQIIPDATVVFRSSSIVAQHNAVASGLGGTVLVVAGCRQ